MAEQGGQRLELAVGGVQALRAQRPHALQGGQRLGPAAGGDQAPRAPRPHALQEGQRLGPAADGGQAPRAPRPRAPQDLEVLVVNNEWKKGNPNREVTHRKFVLAPMFFTTEFGADKSDNKELQDCYDRLYTLKKIIGTAKSANAMEMFDEASLEYGAIFERVMLIRATIRDRKGFALPIPKKLKKLKIRRD